MRRVQKPLKAVEPVRYPVMKEGIVVENEGAMKNVEVVLAVDAKVQAPVVKAKGEKNASGPRRCRKKHQQHCQKPESPTAPCAHPSLPLLGW
ncbi:MAG: hypothetical protein KatS3mg131_1363 [Candidatus Tectimicrobiota bacterium]|nr:MAG: hypothetical protein KatS3mg131_1363 [Candidatus Tectomicrobia bacterium]